MELRNGFSDLSASIERAGVVPRPTANASVYLHPGQLVVSAEPRTLTTILGSCVAVCLWDLSTRTGGMVHFLLPESASSTAEPSARYGDAAIDLLIKEFTRHGGNMRFAKARVYGGACVLRAFRSDSGDHLGARNVQVAKEALRRAHIGIVEEDTLGTVSRKIIFDTASGNVTLVVVGESHGA